MALAPAPAHPRRAARYPVWTSRAATLLAALLVLGLLAACGGDDDDDAADPTPGRPATSSTSAVATTAPAAPRAATPAGVGAATPAAAGSPAAGAPQTVADLSAIVGAAWADVRSYRTTTTATGATGGALASPVARPAVAPGASPVAAPPAGGSTVVIVDEVILPDRRRQTTALDGAQVAQFVAVAGRVFLQGGEAAGALGEGDADPGVWVELSPEELSPDTAAQSLAVGLAAPISAPFAAITPREAALPLTRLGQREVAGRACAAYGVADTTATGERIDVVVALGEDGLPCSIETRAGGTVNLVVYDAYNPPLTIEIPPLGTPVATPVAGP